VVPELTNTKTSEKRWERESQTYGLHGREQSQVRIAFRLVRSPLMAADIALSGALGAWVAMAWQADVSTARLRLSRELLGPPIAMGWPGIGVAIF
jgi:hypothetical protein